MAWGKGTDALFSCVKATTWGTPGTVNAALKGFRPVSYSWEDNIEEITDESFNADAVRKESDKTGRYRISGTFDVELKYQGLEIPIALFMGTAGVPTTVGSYYRHTLYRAISMDGIFGSLAWDDGVKTHTVDSVKFTSLALSGTMAGTVTASFGWTGRKRTEGNTDGLGSVTEPTLINRVQCIASLTDDNYQITTQAADSLANIDLNSWSVNMVRTYDDDDRVFDSANAPWRREMCAQRFETTGTMQIPHEATTYLTTNFHAGTTHALKLGHIVTADEEEATIALPSLTITSATANMGDMGGIPQILNFRGDKADAAPTGFSQVVPYIELLNSMSTNPLA